MADWETVTVLRKKPPKPSTMKTEKMVNVARRQGLAVETTTKWGAASNKQHGTLKNTAKLDQETEELKHSQIPIQIGKAIQQGRQTKGISQKDLASRINEKPQIIQEYEAGKGLVNQEILRKIERELGIKVRGKNVGVTPQKPPGTKK